MAAKQLKFGPIGPQLYDPTGTIPGLVLNGFLGDDIQAFSVDGLSLRDSAGVTGAKIISPGLALVNMVSGSMFHHMSATTIALTDSLFLVVTGWTAGVVNGTTITNTQEVTIVTDGRYHITWTFAGSMVSGANQDLEFSVFKNGVEQNEGCAFRRFQPATDIGSVSGVGTFDLVATDVMDLRINNTTSSNDIVLECANFDVVRTGD